MLDGRTHEDDLSSRFLLGHPIRHPPETLNSSKEKDLVSSARSESIKAFAQHTAHQQSPFVTSSFPTNLKPGVWIKPMSANVTSGEGTPLIPRMLDPVTEKRPSLFQPIANKGLPEGARDQSQPQILQKFLSLQKSKPNIAGFI